MYVEHHKILQNLDSLEPAKIPEVHIKDKETKRIKKKNKSKYFSRIFIFQQRHVTIIMMIHVVVIIMIYREWRRAIAETSCFNTATVYFKTITYGGFNIVFRKLCIEPRQIFKYTNSDILVSCLFYFKINDLLDVQ